MTKIIVPMLLVWLLVMGCTDTPPSSDISIDNEQSTDSQTESLPFNDTDSNAAADTDSMPLPSECYPETDVYIHSTEELAQITSYPCIRGNLLIMGVDVTHIEWPNLRWVGEMVTISWCNHLQNLDGFSVLTSIGDQLEVSQNPALTSLDGLQSLSSVNQIFITDNSHLTDISALSSVETAWSIHIERNPQLETLDGLEQIQNLSWTLGIAENESLSDITALQQLLSIGNGIYISNNPSLPRCQVCDLKARVEKIQPLEIFNSIGNAADECSANCTFLVNEQSCLEGKIVIEDAADETMVAPYSCIEGSLQLVPSSLNTVNLPNLETITGSLWIGDEQAYSAQQLNTLNGLSALRSVGQSISVQSVPLLENLEGLEQLETLGTLRIFNNAALTSLAALSNISSLNSLQIGNNPHLIELGLDGLTELTEDYTAYENDLFPQCDAFELQTQLTTTPMWTCIQDNAPDSCESTCPLSP